MWNMKCMVILVVMGATGRVTKDLKKNLETIPGKYSIDSLQKTSMFRNVTHKTDSTAHRNLKSDRWGSPFFQETC